MKTEQPSPTNGHTRRREATRAALLDLAAELFATRGYMQTSMRDLVREGPVTMAAIYTHFRNKADLLVETINDRIDADLESFERAEDHPPDHVSRLMQAALDYRRRRTLRALLVEAAAAAHTDDDTLARVREAQVERVNGWVDAYQSSRDRLDIDDALDLPTAVLYSWAAELGLGVLESFGIEPSSPEAWADIQRRLALSWKRKDR